MQAKVKTRLALVSAGWLLWPAVAFAHSLSPTHYPLGPVPFTIWQESLLLTFMIPLTLAVETLVLWTWARQLGVLGNLWRTAILYVVGRLAETAAVVCMAAAQLPTGWSATAMQALWTLALFLLAGWAGKLGAARFLYRRASFHVRQLLVPVALATVAGYLSAMALILVTQPSAARDLLYLLTEWRR
jgi:hypothetical protein